MLLLIRSVWHVAIPLHFHPAVSRGVFIPREMTFPSPRSIRTCGWVRSVSVLPHRTLQVLSVPCCRTYVIIILTAFTVDIDTGSSDLFLPNQSCASTCDGHNRYDPTASSTSVNLGQTFTLQYNGGSSVNGTVYADNVYMGGYEVLSSAFAPSHR